MKYMAAEEEKYWTSPNGTKCEILPEEIAGLRRIMQQASIDREKIERIADPKTRRIKLEEYWADLNEAIWENNFSAIPSPQPPHSRLSFCRTESSCLLSFPRSI